MTKRLLHNAQVIDPEAGTITRADIRIENGLITQVSQSPVSYTHLTLPTKRIV